MTRPAGLYVHIPFCTRKCPYCDFRSHSVADRDPSDYPASVVAEAEAQRRRFEAFSLEFRTLYIGGGTPTVLAPDALAGLVARLLAAMPFTANPEVTVEANPGSLNREMARALLEVGVNRLSLGVQSYQDPLLRTLGRVHDAPTAWEATLLASSFPRFSVDLIHGVPSQAAWQAVSDVRTAVNLGARHVSAYTLTYEGGTEFARLRASGELTPVDEDSEAVMFAQVGEALEGAGLRRYEISNFSVPGEESRHNLGYWRGSDYLGLGAAAHSTVAGRRWWNHADPGRYVAAVRSGGDPVEGEERLSPADMLLERVMLGLRMRSGTPLEELLALADEAGDGDFRERVERELASGGLELREGLIRVTEAALAHTDAVIARLA